MCMTWVDLHLAILLKLVDIIYERERLVEIPGKVRFGDQSIKTVIFPREKTFKSIFR